MFEVKIGSGRRFYYQDLGGDAGLAPTLDILDDAGNLVKTAEAATNDLSARLPAVYRTASLTFSSGGKHRFVWSVSGQVKSVGEFVVVQVLTGDAAVSIPQKYFYESPGLAVANELIAEVFDLDGKSVFNAPITVTTSAFTDGDAFTTITTKTDHGLATSQKIKLSGHSVGALNGNRVVTVTGVKTFTIPITGDGAGGVDGSFQIVSVVTSTAGVYETHEPIALDVTGDYILSWRDDEQGASWTVLVPLLFVADLEKRTVIFFALDTTVDPTVPHVGARALLSKADGTPLKEETLNVAGKALFSAPNGSYVLTIQKSGVTYDKNNLAVTVVDPGSVLNANKFFLMAGSFAPTFDTDVLFGDSDISLMTVRLVNIEGKPLVGVSVLVTNEHVASTVTGVGGKKSAVLGGPIYLTTNGNGYAEARLIRGQKVIIAFEGSGVRRSLVVPSVATFDLMDEIDNIDPFDIYVPNVVSAVRRS